MGPDASDGASGLPAPYRNPWRNLADDLRAVRADLGLRIRQAWRQNREGSLWRPPWWPRDLAPLFWPLLVGVLPALLLVLVISVLPVGSLRPSAPAPGSGLQPAQDRAVASGSAVAGVDPPLPAASEQRLLDEPLDDPLDDPLGASVDDPVHDAVTAPVSRPVQATPDHRGSADRNGGSADRSQGAAGSAGSRAAGSRAARSGAVGTAGDRAENAAAGPSADGSPAPGALPEPGAAAPAPDPVALLLASEELAGLVAGADPLAAGTGLRLRLEPAFQRLAAPERQRRAELWLAQVQGLGYDHLELVDGRGRLQGRDALVGGGMIVFSSAPSA